MNETLNIWFEDSEFDLGLDEYMKSIFAQLELEHSASNINNFHQYEYQ